MSFFWGGDTSAVSFTVRRPKIFDFFHSSFKLWVLILLYFIKRKMKGIRYISTVLHYSSCMKRQSKMAALHAATALWIIQMLFLSLFIVWWCLNQLKQIKVSKKLIEFPISLAENIIQTSCRFASPSHYEDFQGDGSDAREPPHFCTGVPCTSGLELLFYCTRMFQIKLWSVRCPCSEWQSSHVLVECSSISLPILWM